MMKMKIPTLLNDGAHQLSTLCKGFPIDSQVATFVIAVIIAIILLLLLSSFNCLFYPVLFKMYLR